MSADALSVVLVPRVETVSKLRLRKVLQALLVLRGLPKTLVFNLRYLPLRQAVRLPVVMSHRVALLDLSGTVTLNGPVRPGMVLLGFGQVGAFDFRRSRSVWQVAGDVVFEGRARLGNGFKLSVGGRLTLGDDFVLSAESQLVCHQSITFGRGCLVSWDVLVLDSDFHEITYENGSTSTVQAPVVLGDRVWVGARASVLKGVQLGDDVVVAAGSMVSRSVQANGVVLAGNPAQVVREGVRWRR
jgi:acetyltransferase-like isoleucine patch superfamily enzyme